MWVLRWLARLTYGLSNRNPEASKPSKLLEDRTQFGPHQPLAWLDFLHTEFKTSNIYTREYINRIPCRHLLYTT